MQLNNKKAILKKLDISRLPHPQELFQHHMSLDKAKFNYQTHLLHPYAGTGRTPRCHQPLRELIVYLVNLLIVDLDTQRSENPVDYMDQVFCQDYFKLKTSRGQIARACGYMWTGTEKHSKLYESAKRNLDKDILKLMTLESPGIGPMIIHKNISGTHDRGKHRGLELWISKEYLTLNEVKLKPGHVTDKKQGITGEIAPGDAQNAPERTLLKSLDNQQDTKKFASTGVPSFHGIKEYKIDYNKNAANVDNPSHTDSTPPHFSLSALRAGGISDERSEGSSEENFGTSQDPAKEKTGTLASKKDESLHTGAAAAGPGEIHLSFDIGQMPANFRDMVPGMELKRERYESLNLRGSEMQRLAHKLMNIFVVSILQPNNIPLQFNHYEMGKLQMEELMFYLMHGGKETLDAYTAYNRLVFGMTLLHQTMEHNKKENIEADYFRYGVNNYLSTERNEQGGFQFYSCSFVRLLTETVTKRLKTMNAKEAKNKYQTTLNRAITLVKKYANEFDEKCFDKDGAYSYDKRIETVRKHTAILDKQFAKLDILSEKDKAMLKQLYATSCAAMRTRFD